jgi:hypothetical protein
MAKYQVTVDWSGYSRGCSIWEVEAESEDDARENWYCGEEIERDTIRDDTEGEVSEIVELDE